MRHRMTALLVLAVIVMSLSACQVPLVQDDSDELDAAEWLITDLDSIPAYNGTAFCVINNNTPYFSESDYTTDSFEFYSELDELGRCGMCWACIGKDLMPTEERGEIGQIKPSGWHTVRYEFIEKKYLYNRCHLIGYQLTGENDNERNLITGTRYFNTEGMLPFENEVAYYIRRTGNHVLYRVVPLYEGKNLLATGVTIEAKSVEDDGRGVQFNVFCYNVQPGVVIDYATGDSKEDLSGFPSRSFSSTSSDSKPESIETEPLVVFSEGSDYVLNTRSKRFHLPTCESVQEMSAKNRKEYQGTREELIEEGYSPCGVCKP